MKKLCYSVFCSLLAGVMIASCSNYIGEDKGNDIDDEGILPVKTEEAISAFFDAELATYSQRSQSFFYDQGAERSLDMTIVHVINSWQELADIYQGDRELPEIDFNKYTLIIGQNIMPCRGFYLVSHRLVEAEDGLHICLHTRIGGDMFTTAIDRLPYWGLYPKLTKKIVAIESFEEYTELPANNRRKSCQLVEQPIVYKLPRTQYIQFKGKEREMVRKTNKFTYDLYKAASKSEELKGKSLLLSPIGVVYTLGMLNASADGETQKEITSLLGLSDYSTEEINACCQTLMTQAPLTDPSVTLQSDNIMATSEDMGLELTNTSSFKATWTEKFDPADTHYETFTNEDGQTSTVPMMHRKAITAYYHDDTASILCLPYGSGSKWDMFVMLPNEGKTVDDAIERYSWLINDNYYMFYWSRNYEVDIKIPRFSADSEIVMNDIVSQMGAPLMFSEAADFSKMTSDDQQLSVSLLKQRACIEVSEEGTKSSVVPALIDIDYSPRDRADFHANRPFIYIIRERCSGAVFFIGTFKYYDVDTPVDTTNIKLNELL